jgi:4-nitrophenyl phosphatase
MPGAGEALRTLAEAGFALLFATNNSARTPDDVVDKLRRVADFAASPQTVVTSAQVAAGLVEAGPVLVAGEEGIVAAITEAGFAVTDDASEAATVVAGLDRGLSYDRVARAADAVRGGAHLVVTNRDPTFPVAEGLMPGAGACAAAIETAAGVIGTTAGKPTEAMRRHLEARAPAGPIWMVGDRVDTDIALAQGPRWRSILVLTGVTTSATDLDPIPDHVVDDLEAAARLLLARTDPATR